MKDLIEAIKLTLVIVGSIAVMWLMTLGVLRLMQWLGGFL